MGNPLSAELQARLENSIGDMSNPDAVEKAKQVYRAFGQILQERGVDLEQEEDEEDLYLMRDARDGRFHDDEEEDEQDLYLIRGARDSRFHDDEEEDVDDQADREAEEEQKKLALARR